MKKSRAFERGFFFRGAVPVSCGCIRLPYVAIARRYELVHRRAHGAIPDHWAGSATPRREKTPATAAGANDRHSPSGHGWPMHAMAHPFAGTQVHRLVSNAMLARERAIRRVRVAQSRKRRRQRNAVLACAGHCSCAPTRKPRPAAACLRMTKPCSAPNLSTLPNRWNLSPRKPYLILQRVPVPAIRKPARRRHRHGARCRDEHACAAR